MVGRQSRGGITTNLDVKELLSAFVQKCYENYQQERELRSLAQKLSKEIG